MITHLGKRYFWLYFFEDPRLIAMDDNTTTKARLAVMSYSGVVQVFDLEYLDYRHDI